MLNCAVIGRATPIWDSRDKFGDTDLMVTSMAMGRDLARGIGNNPTALMRGHGSVAVGKTIRQAVFIAIKLQESADFQREASRFKDVKYLSDGEIAKVQSLLDFADIEKPLRGIDRAWEYWCYRAGETFRATNWRTSCQNLSRSEIRQRDRLRSMAATICDSVIPSTPVTMIGTNSLAVAKLLA